MYNVCMMQKEKHGCKLNNDFLVNTPKASILDLVDFIYVYINPRDVHVMYLYLN